MTVKLAYNELEQFLDGNANPYSGGLLFTYSAGSSTKLNTYKTSAGNTANTNPIVLDSNGRIPYAIWLTSGSTYKFVLAPSTDTDPPISPIWSLDDISGINDTSVSLDQWISGPTPTYVSTTSFTLVGDQTSTFNVGRRVKTTNSGGTIYSTITASAYTSLTTITVANDSGTLDSGLSAVSYGLLTSTNISIPGGSRPASTQYTGIFNANIPVPTNLRLTGSVSSSALTIALKGNDGNDPSSASPVYVPFRDVTSATGDMVWISVTSATSLVISSGSTMGTTSGVPNRLWVVAFNDSGTFRLGAINCLTSTAVFPLQNGIFSSTAEGGAGAADSAGVIYTGTAVSSKAMTILGYVESTQATAGTWATTPSLVQPFTDDVKLPGSTVQVQDATPYATYNNSLTTAIPKDDTIPQSSEGSEIVTKAITPTFAGNRLEISCVAPVITSDNRQVTMALFQDSTANALSVSSNNLADQTVVYQMSLFYSMLAGTASATTFKLRIGPDAGTCFLNGNNGGRFFGGIASVKMNIKEIMG